MGQKEQIAKLLCKGRPVSTYEICRIVYKRQFGICRVASRVHEIRKTGVRVVSRLSQKNANKCYYYIPAHSKENWELAIDTFDKRRPSNV